VHRTPLPFCLLFLTLLASGCVDSEDRQPDLTNLRDPWALPIVPTDPILAAGQQVFNSCASCHLADAGGRPDGTIPRLAGQDPTILERRLRALFDDSVDLPVMTPFARALTIEEIDQVSNYLSSLPRPALIGVGSGDELERGAEVYTELCQSCHAADGVGQSELNAPLLCGQHAAYSLRRLDEISGSSPRVSDPAMRAVAAVLPPRDRQAVSDYLSRLECD
jgi:cytochrome c553